MSLWVRGGGDRSEVSTLQTIPHTESTMFLLLSKQTTVTTIFGKNIYIVLQDSEGNALSEEEFVFPISTVHTSS